MTVTVAQAGTMVVGLNREEERGKRRGGREGAKNDPPNKTQDIQALVYIGGENPEHRAPARNC